MEKTMNLKDKINACLKKAISVSVNDFILYVKEIFPENEYDWDTVQESNDFYVEHEDIIHLSNENLTKLVISYPGGDRFGSSLSDPYTDVYFSTPMSCTGNLLYLYRESKYNVENEIAKNIEGLVSDIKSNTSEIINELNQMSDAKHYVSNSFFERLDTKALNNAEVKKAIADNVNCTANFKSIMAYEQYEYGRYGGLDIGECELSGADQFKLLWDNLPERIEKACHKELEEKWLSYPEAKDTLLKDKKEFIEQIELFELWQQHGNAYIKEIHDRYEMLRKYKAYLGSDSLCDIDKRARYEELNCLDYKLDSFTPESDVKICEKKLQEISDKINLSIEKKDGVLNEISRMRKIHFHFWQQSKKRCLEIQISDLNEDLSLTEHELIYLRCVQKLILDELSIARNYDADVRALQDSYVLDEYPPLSTMLVSLTSYARDEMFLSRYKESEFISRIKKSIEQINCNEIRKKLEHIEGLLSRIEYPAA